MEEQIALNLAYRNICFYDFFYNSLICYQMAGHSLSKDQKLEDRFILKNEENLNKYNDKKKLEGENSSKATTIKKDVIKEWAKNNKIKTSKALSKYELESLLETIISNVIEIINDNKKNGILHILFPVIIDNMIYSFNQLKRWKDSLKKQFLEEESKNTIILNDNFNKDKLFKDYQNQSNKERKKLSSKIIDLQKVNSNLFDQIISLNKML